MTYFLEIRVRLNFTHNENLLFEKLYDFSFKTCLDPLKFGGFCGNQKLHFLPESTNEK